jgi:histidinol-phosphatase (PHP family)
MIPQDYHIHTDFSCDCRLTMLEMCRAAVEKGIPEIGFTDHFDLVPQDPCSAYFQADAWWEELARCRDAFRKSLTIRAGIEIGEGHLFKHEVRQLYEAYPWDYSLGSLHWVGSGLVFDREFFDRPAEEVYRSYFSELGRMAKEADFDVLAHMDVVKRYGYDAYGPFDPKAYENEIRATLRTLAARGKALEVNTATLRRSVDETSPSVDVMRWFREEGGRWVTIGSDAHRAEHLGDGLEQALREVISAGFQSLASFHQRSPSVIAFNSRS